MKNGWTGGQYSVFRGIFGLYLLIHFAALLPWGAELFSSEGVLPSESSPLLFLFPNILALHDGPWFVTALLIVGVAASGMFLVGWRDRIAALVIWYLLACLVGRNPLILNPSLPFVGWLLLVHSVLPRAPFGSVDARFRTDPRGDWTMPPSLFAAAWVVMSAGYSYSGWTKLVSPSWVDGTALARVMSNPLARDTALREIFLAIPHPLLALATWGALALELFFVIFALVRPLRPWAWLAMLSMHIGLVALIDFADLSLGMVMVHLFTFNPDWIPAVGDRRDRVFYDGTCGLCHGTVRWLLAEDRQAVLDFSPLASKRFENLRAGIDESVPDSVVVETGGGIILTRSEAVIHLLGRLGGVWRMIGWIVRLIPGRIRDAAYDVVARVRRHLFTRPSGSCPILPADLQQRVG